MVNNPNLIKSTYLIRTHTGLTTNVFMVVDSQNRLYLESIDTNYELSDVKYKHVSVNPSISYDVALSLFWNSTSDTNLIYDSKKDVVNYIPDSLSEQYDNLTWSGASPVSDNWYREEHQYIAPLHIRDTLPESFIVLRVDGFNSYGSIHNTLKKAKMVHYTSLKDDSVLGTYLNRYISQTSNPKYPITIDYKSGQWSRVSGINVSSGGFTEVGLLLDTEIDINKPIYQFEQEMMSIFKQNKIAHSRVINLKYLFNDTPQKYTLNQYYGFYLDKIEPILTLTPYIPPYILKSNLYVQDNYIVDDIVRTTLPVINGVPNPALFIDPFEGNYKKEIDDREGYWIWYDDDFWKIERVELEYAISPLDVNNFRASDVIERINPVSNLPEFFTRVYAYRLAYTGLLNVPLDNSFNDKTRVCRFENNIISINTNPSNYDSFDIGTINLLNTLTSENIDWTENDLYLIDIGDKSYVLSYSGEDGGASSTSPVLVNSDAVIASDFSRLILGDNLLPLRYTNKRPSFKQNDGKPLRVVIKKAHFTSICDIDQDRVISDHTRYDYELNNILTNTPQIKHYKTDEFGQVQREPIHPRIDLSFQDKAIPASSEYASQSELFQIKSGYLSDIYSTGSALKFGAVGSYDHAELPYRLNNSLDFGQFNKNADTLRLTSSRLDRTHDWFLVDLPVVYGWVSRYTVNRFSYSDWASGLDSFNDTLSGDITYFMGDSQMKQRHRKYAIIGGEHNRCIFKGVKYELNEVNKIKADTLTGGYNLVFSPDNNKYYGYSFAPLLTFTPDNSIVIDDTKKVERNSRIKIRVLVNHKYKQVLLNVDIRITNTTSYPNLLDNYEERFINLYQSSDLNSSAFYALERIYDEGITYTSPLGSTNLLDPSEVDYLCIPAIASSLSNAFSPTVNSGTPFEISYHVYGLDGLVRIYNQMNNWGDETLPVTLNILKPEGYYVVPDVIDIIGVDSPDFTPKPDWLNYKPDSNSLVGLEWFDPIIRNAGYTIEINRPPVTSRDDIVNGNEVLMYRHSFSYDFIERELSLFGDDTNVKFNSSYTDFGLTCERMLKKVFRGPIPLQQANTTSSTPKYVYPAIDEYPYYPKRLNIFKLYSAQDYYDSFI
jgi:hypothetical protein